LIQYGRAGRLLFCAQSLQSVALAFRRVPHAPQRLNTRTPFADTSR
jgi:hypothetical protein